MWWFLGLFALLLVGVPAIALMIAASADNNDEDDVWDFDRQDRL